MMGQKLADEVRGFLKKVADFQSRRQIANINVNLVAIAPRESVSDAGKRAVDAQGEMFQSRADIRETAIPLAELLEANGVDATVVYRIHHWVAMPYAATPDWEDACIELRRLISSLNRSNTDNGSVASGDAHENAHDAHRNKLFPIDGKPTIDVKDAITKLDTCRDGTKLDMDILREFTGEAKHTCPKAKSLQAKIRAARDRGETTLPPAR